MSEIEHRIPYEKTDDTLQRQQEALSAEGTIIHDRDLQEYEKLLDLNLEELKDKRILDLGSGEFQTFAREAERQLGGATKVVAYDYNLKERDISEYQQSQKIDAAAGLFSTLPFKEESFDTILSLYGYPLHVHADRITMLQGLNEILRVLKPGGGIHLYPADRLLDAKDKTKVPQDIQTVLGAAIETKIVSRIDAHSLVGKLLAKVGVTPNKKMLLVLRKFSQNGIEGR